MPEWSGGSIDDLGPNYSSFTIFAEWFSANISGLYEGMLQNCIPVCWVVLELFAENNSAKLVNQL